MKPETVILIVEDFNIGGLERIVESIYFNLDPNRYKAQIWCIANGGELADELMRKRERIKVFNIRSYYNPLNVLKLAFFVKKDKCRIVHTHGYFASTIGRLAAFIARTPVIISHVHTTASNLSIRNLLIEGMLSRITDCIICCSFAAKEFMVGRVNLQPHKIKIIYNGVPIPQMNRIDPCDQPKSQNKIQLVIVASLVENKGHKYLFQAVALLQKEGVNVNLLIVGEGPQKNFLLHYADHLKISKSTRFLGKINHIGDVLQNSDILVLPSIEREGLGVAIIESMSFGLPVIGSNVGVIPEVVKNEKTGFIVPPRDPVVLAEKLKILIQDQNIRYRMGIAGKKRFERKFKMKTMISKIENLYQNQLDRI